MDVAGGVHAYAYAQTRVVTVGIEAMSFHQPVFVGEEVSFYTEIEKIGTTSITIKIEAWAKRKSDGQDVHVTEGLFTYVSIDENRQPKPINKGGA
jgi:acyl-CoA thioesterase YciA